MYSKNNSSQEKPKFYNGHRNRKSHDELKISNEDFNEKLNDQNISTRMKRRLLQKGDICRGILDGMLEFLIPFMKK